MPPESAFTHQKVIRSTDTGHCGPHTWLGPWAQKTASTTSVCVCVCVCVRSFRSCCVALRCASLFVLEFWLRRRLLWRAVGIVGALSPLPPLLFSLRLCRILLRLPDLHLPDSFCCGGLGIYLQKAPVVARKVYVLLLDALLCGGGTLTIL